MKYLSFKFITCLAILTVFFACGKSQPPLNHGDALESSQSTLCSLDSLRVKELFLVIFEKDFSETEWQTIFNETNSLSANKKALRTIEGLNDSKSQNLRAGLIGSSSQLLLDLSAKSLFLLSWSAADENCRVSKEGSLLTCKPFNLDNSLNGGLPKSLSPIAWMIPDPVRDDIKSPYLRINLTLNAQSNSDPHFDLTLRLKPENLETNEKLFKGDVIPKAGSAFRREDGTLSENYYPFGYSEITFQK